MFDYDVFFSYRHRPLDSEITQKLFNLAENYRLPASLREKGLHGVRRAFRDTEELPVSRILTDTIDKALHSTDCLVVVCSTDTPSSEWVDREVATFIEIGRADHVFPILISGDPETSFPASMKLIPDINDRIMDIRSEGNDTRKMMSLAETEMLRVIACVAGCTEDELIRENGIEQSSMKILNELTYGLPDRLSDVPGSYSRIRDILHSNTEDINKILRLTRNREAGEYEAAVNYEKLATAENVLGMHDEALDSENTAITIFETLEKDGYEKAEAGTASGYNNRAIILNSAGRYDEAGADYDKAIDLQQALGNGNSLVLARMIFNSGSNAVDMGDGDLAAERFDQSLELLYNMERSADVLDALGTVEYNYGVLLYRSGMYDEAEEMLSDACDDQSDLIGMNGTAANRSKYIQSTSMLAACLTDAGKYDEADRYYDEAIKAAEILAEDEENISYQQMLAELYNNRGLSHNIRGNYIKADEYYSDASDVYGKIYEKTGSDPDRAAYAVSLLNTGENAFKAYEYKRSKEFFIRGLDEYKRVADSLGTYHKAQYLAWRSYYELIHLKDFDAALASASEAYELQPDNTLVKMNYAYACLYSGEEDLAEKLLGEIASSGTGEADTIKRDLQAQKNAGLKIKTIDI